MSCRAGIEPEASRNLSRTEPIRNISMITQPHWISVVAVCLATLASASEAQELRWKFAKGDEFSVVQTQTTTVDTRVEKRDSNIESSVSLVGSWKVTNVSDDKAATIEQTIESIKVAIDNPANRTKSVAIDTANSDRPAKNSRALLKDLQPLIGMTLQLQMNNRGEVIEIVVPAETQAKLDAIPTDSSLRTLLGPEKIEVQIRSSNLALPESVHRQNVGQAEDDIRWTQNNRRTASRCFRAINRQKVRCHEIRAS